MSQQVVRGMLIGASFAVLALGGTGALAMDDETAKALLKKNECSKCHAMDKEKKGPAYQKIASTNKGKADAEAKLVKSMTSGGKVKLPDGTEEEHKKLEASPAQVKDLAHWILAQ